MCNDYKMGYVATTMGFACVYEMALIHAADEFGLPLAEIGGYMAQELHPIKEEYPELAHALLFNPDGTMQYYTDDLVFDVVRFSSTIENQLSDGSFPCDININILAMDEPFVDTIKSTLMYYAAHKINEFVKLIKKDGDAAVTSFRNRIVDMCMDYPEYIGKSDKKAAFKSFVERYVTKYLAKQNDNLTGGWVVSVTQGNLF